MAKKIQVQLLNQDSLEALKTISTNSIDLILCDLPYAITKNDWDSIIPLDGLFKEYKRICKDNAPIILFGAMPFTADLLIAGRDIFRFSLVWRKNKSTGHLNAKIRPMRQHEDILVFCKKSPIYNPQKSTGHKPMNFAVNESRSLDGDFSTNYGKVKPTSSNAGSTERFPTSVLDFKIINNDDPSKIHPTQKPIELLEYLIKTFSNEKSIVLDNTMGSGSTGVAAIKTNRKFIGIELNKKFFKHASKWIKSELRGKNEK